MQLTDATESLSTYQWYFLTELEQKFPKTVYRHKRPCIARAILREKNGAGENQAPGLHTILQRYSHQNSMVLAQKQKY